MLQSLLVNVYTYCMCIFVVLIALLRLVFGWKVIRLFDIFFVGTHLPKVGVFCAWVLAYINLIDEYFMHCAV
jgi:hypothetical protein